MEYYLKNVDITVAQTEDSFELFVKFEEGRMFNMSNMATFGSEVVLNMDTSGSEVSKYFAGKRIFLTGATGFVGKVFLEKILRSCPEIDGIFCLVRDKKGLDGNARIYKLCQEPVFDLLRRSDPSFSRKIHAIRGDFSDTVKLGISEQDLAFLRENIQLVFHSAADISFHQTLKDAIQQNILPTKTLVDIAKSMRRLECFVHVSTAYAFCDREVINEQVYSTTTNPQKILEIVSELSDDAVESVTPHLKGKHPNTYTFSKQLCENILVQQSSDMPLVIVRPSVIGPSLKEPFEGFIDQMNYISALGIGMGKGALRTLYAKKSAIIDLIPVDICVNVMITSAWLRSLHTSMSGPTIYQPTSGVSNPLTMRDFEQYGALAFQKWPMENAVMTTPKSILTENRMVNYCCIVKDNLIPGYAIDFFLRLTGKKPFLMKMYTKAISTMKTLEYFSTRSWQWSVKNIDKLQSSLSLCDKEIFPVDVRSINWQSYTEQTVKGIKLFILKEDVQNLNKARSRLRRLHVAKCICYVFFAVVMCVFIMLMLNQTKSTAY